MTNFDKKYNEYLEYFNVKLNEYCSNMSFKPELLNESMKYSLLLGGKRVRPVLLLAVADMLGTKREEVINFAIALEMIHTYSLIHDDLPAMDDDDFRRGKPSNHKKFGEGNAILAGDALLNTALSICIEECFKGRKYIAAAKYLSDCAGAGGMIAGQSLDLSLTGKESFTKDDLDFIYEHKTGKLLMAPVTIAGILSESKYTLELESFGKNFGTLFQLTDDILDVTGTFENMGKSIGKDEDENKLTSVKLYGLQGSMIRADMCAQDCLTILEALNCDVSFLRDFVYFVRNRNN